MEASIMKTITLIMMMGIVMGSSSNSSSTNDMAQKCSNAFQKLETCLGYASGQANAPSKECCSSVAGIKDSDPACLCFIIQQAHNGSPAIKSTGIQESRLLLLPSTCHLNNASISNCPKLLNLAPNSTDAKIFVDPLLTNGTTTPSTPIGMSTDKGSSGWRIMNDAPYVQELIVVIAVAVLTSTTDLFSF